jgi:Xaa-Pro aminopeptidase
MTSRIAQVRKLARQRRCTHVLVSDPVDVEYLSGFRSTNAYLLIGARDTVLFTDFRYRIAAQQFCGKNSRWRFVETGEESFAAFRPFLKRGSRVGVQSESMSVDQFDRLRAQCRAAEFVRLRGALAQTLMAKLPREIASMRRAARIGDRAFAAFTKCIKRGTSEMRAVRLLDDLCRRFGSEGPSFPTIVLFGARAALPHGRPSGRKLRKGDWILCDFGCSVDGLCSDMTRTVVMGRATEKQRRVYATVFLAQREARMAVRAGAAASDVDMRARSIIEKAGYGKAFGHATGHGVGRRIHERPRLGRVDRTILLQNMVVTVEPGIYLQRWGGVRIEDMLQVTGKGGRCLTGFPRSLIEIGR